MTRRRERPDKPAPDKPAPVPAPAPAPAGEDEQQAAGEEQALAEQLRGEAAEIGQANVASEEARVRAALQDAGGFVSRAAAALGWPRSRLTMAIGAGGRWAMLGAWAAQLRARGGWVGGRPRKA